MNFSEEKYNDFVEKHKECYSKVDDEIARIENSIRKIMQISEEYGIPCNFFYNNSKGPDIVGFIYKPNPLQDKFPETENETFRFLIHKNTEVFLIKDQKPGTWFKYES